MRRLFALCGAAAVLYLPVRQLDNAYAHREDARIQVAADAAALAAAVSIADQERARAEAFRFAWENLGPDTAALKVRFGRHHRRTGRFREGRGGYVNAVEVDLERLRPWTGPFPAAVLDALRFRSHRSRASAVAEAGGFCIVSPTCRFRPTSARLVR